MTVETQVKYSLTTQQAIAFRHLTDSRDVELVYGGARGGGKSHLMCIWVYMWTTWLIQYFNLQASQYPIPVGFFGRKQGSDFQKTTLETFKKIIPSAGYEIRIQDHEIVIDNKAKVYFGGLDSQEAVSKFTSSELAFRAIDQAEETSARDLADLGGALRLVINGKRPPYKTLYTANPAECHLKSEFIPPWGPEKRTSEDQPHKIFVPALPTDNPHLPSGYIARLKDSYKYDKALQRAMIEGDWNVLSGFAKIFTLTEIADCFLPEAEQFEYHEKTVIAFDSARFGDDKSCIYVMKNRNIVEREIYGKKDHEFTYGRIREWDDLTGNKALIVGDKGGQVGASVLDSLGRVMESRILGIDFGGKATNEQYRNKRTEMYLAAQTDVRNRRVGIPREWTDLHNELTQIEFSYRNEKFFLEPKELIKKRIQGSPDNSDTFVMALEGARHFDDMMGTNDAEIKTQAWADEELNQPEWAIRNKQKWDDENAHVPRSGMYT